METVMGKADEESMCSQECQQGETVGIRGTELLPIVLF